jgi:hypothetical protein
MVDVTVANMNLSDGHVTVGFGSDDVQVRRVWVTGPNRLTVSVAVSGNAALGTSEVSVISGMQLALAPNAFQTQAPQAGAPLILGLANASDPSQSSFQAGQFAVIFGQNLTGAQIAVNDVPVQPVFAGATQINFVVPAGLAAGPAVLRLIAPGGSAFPVVFQLDARPPVISGVNNGGGAAAAGDALQVMIGGLDASVLANPHRLRLTVSSLEMPIQQITPVSPGVYMVQLTITQSFGGAPVPVVAAVDGSQSAPFHVTVR